MKKHLYSILFIVLIGSLLISSVFYSGWYTSHDGVYHILRTEEALRVLKLGHFPIRWAGTLDQGFGIPLWNFVYPLPYYLSAAASLVMGAVWGVKSVIVISYLMGGLGIYILFSKKSRFIGMALALIYLMTPYQFLNLFVRGALGEIMAMGLMPWVLVSFASLSNPSSSLKWYHPIPLALLLVAHNFLGILFAIFLIGYVIFQVGNKRQVFSSLAISFGLAAFFLLPMIIERDYLHSFDVKTTSFRYDQHFVAWRQMLYSKWDYWYSVPGDNDGMSFQLGLSQMIMSVVGIASIVFNKKRNWASLYLVFAYLGSIFLMNAKSFYIWEKITILQTVQFPWRLLFMTAILTPLLGYAFVNRLKSKNLQVIFLYMMLVLSIWNVRNYRRPMKFLTASEYTDLYLLNVGKTTTTQRIEILPKWSILNERFKSEELLVNAGNMIIDSLSSTPLSVTTTINNKPNNITGRITILRNYYPGWSATMDGKTNIQLTPTDEGMISMNPRLGVHSYVIKMTSTLLEKVANLISLIALIALGIIWQKNRNQIK